MVFFFLGGCTRNGSLIFTFTDNCNENEIKADSYRKAIDYFCNIPSLVYIYLCLCIYIELFLLFFGLLNYFPNFFHFNYFSQVSIRIEMNEYKKDLNKTKHTI